ncbi:MAG TPA: hypothetical protein DEV81_15685, partial [Cyanobacteria bacterium UBA11049]|nr:hypothetical protein [Cyanobacteria bacterium UBA11049]
DREIFLLCIVFSGFLPFGIFFKFLKKYNPFVKQIDYLESRVVECSGRLVAYAKMFNCNDLKILQYLYVTPHYRKQGIGSYIIQNLIQEATKPIYLVAALGKTRYYTRLGFVKLRFNQLAPTVQRKLRQAGISYYFSLRLLVYDRNQK